MSAQMPQQMRLGDSEKLEISGSAPARPVRILAHIFGLALVLFAFVCCAVAYRIGLEEGVTGWIVGGTAALILGLWLPAGQYLYLDVRNGILVKEKYWYFSQRQEETPLSDFTKIIVRHVCHPGEGGETFTGSVGLKPLAGGSVIWLKEFPASEDEIPAEADRFARELAQISGLPYSGHPPALQPSEMFFRDLLS